MQDSLKRLIDAIVSRDPDAMRAEYQADARLVTMTPNTFLVAEGPYAIVARLSEWFFEWEQDPHFSFLGTVRDGDRAVLEFERTSTFDGEPWVVRQAHILQLSGGRIAEHRAYCCGPLKGAADLAAQYAGSAS